MNTESTSSGPFGADPFQADALVATVMGAVRATEQDRPWRVIPPWNGRHLAAVIASVVVVSGGIAGFASSRPSGAARTQSPNGTFHEAGLAFDYPSPSLCAENCSLKSLRPASALNAKAARWPAESVTTRTDP